MKSLEGRWALVLGASSGFGAATCLELARHGANVIGVHLDRRSTLPQAQAVAEGVRAEGVEVRFFNVNAADDARRAEVLDAMADALRASPQGGVSVLLHSLAFGTLRPLVSADAKEAVSKAQLEMTLDVMANSLVYWVQDLLVRGLLARGARIFAMTSAGGTRAWPTYGPVSAAKAALESHVRQLALELAPHGVTVNAIRAGVTDTPALRRIPGHEALVAGARARNPHGRLTTPEDVARAIALLAQDASAWITGNVIGVDGGEDVVG